MEPGYSFLSYGWNLITPMFLLCLHVTIQGMLNGDMIFYNKASNEFAVKELILNRQMVSTTLIGNRIKEDFSKW